MNANLEQIIIFIPLVFVIVSIFACLKLGRRWEKDNPNKLGFKWGYFYIINTFLHSLALLSFLFGIALQEAEFGLIIFSLTLLVALSASSYYSLKRKKFALIVSTLFTLNPLWMVINAFYLKNRWQEFTDEAALIADILNAEGGEMNNADDRKLKSKGWRTVFFGIIVWLTVFPIYVVIFEPYGRYLRGEDYEHILLTALLPSCAVVALYWIYEKYVR
jgi:heme/copper-type cytochrome/quinol oxidase subunit 4